MWYTFPFQSFTLSNDSNSISVPEPGRLRETLTPAAAVLSLVWTLFQHVGLWQVNIMRCNNKASVTAAITNACARAAGSPLNWLIIPVTDIYYVCVRIITTHIHTHTHQTHPAALCFPNLPLHPLQHFCHSVMQHQLFHTTHTHTNYITSFLTILMPSSWIKTNSDIASSSRSQVYSTGGAWLGLYAQCGPAPTNQMSEKLKSLSVLSCHPRGTDRDEWLQMNSRHELKSSRLKFLCIRLQIYSLPFLIFYIQRLFRWFSFFLPFRNFTLSEHSLWDWSLKGHKHAARSLTVKVKMLYCKYFLTA